MPAPSRRRAAQRAAGVSLIELVVAILILSIGTLAAFRALDQATAQVGGETPRLLAVTVARNRAEELGLIGARAGRGLPRSVTMGPHEWRVEVDEETTEAGLVQATIAVTAEGLPGAVLVAFVPVDPPR